MKHRKKSDLPTKVCPVCQRPFTWRKKWAADWDEVVYCSERCRSGRCRSGRCRSGRCRRNKRATD